MSEQTPEHENVDIEELIGEPVEPDVELDLDSFVEDEEDDIEQVEVVPVEEDENW